VGNSRRPHRGRRRGHARNASADALFERALRGADAEDSGPGPFDARHDRKTLQLCRQVQRALSLALAGESADEALRDLYVQSVEPLGSPGQLAVTVILPGYGGVTSADVLARLAAHTPRLRAAVAREISRKRVPNLSFIPVPPSTGAFSRGDAGEGDHHGR
jgi:hypothetical protein